MQNMKIYNIPIESRGEKYLHLGEYFEARICMYASCAVQTGVWIIKMQSDFLPYDPQDEQ